jgi:CheY-like chemotaxis protein
MVIRRLLVVDDDPGIRRLMQTMLERVGYEVVCAESAEAAAQLMADIPFDLVITDVLMPGRDGILFIADIRRRYLAMRIIAASGGGMVGPDAYLQAASSLGADAALPKPFSLLQLQRAIDRAARGD